MQLFKSPRWTFSFMWRTTFLEAELFCFLHFIKNLPFILHSSKVKKREVLATQLCLTLCDPIDYSPPGSSVHRILQARILEWVAILQGIFSSQGSNPGLPHCRQILYPLSHWGSVHPRLSKEPSQSQNFSKQQHSIQDSETYLSLSIFMERLASPDILSLEMSVLFFRSLGTNFLL